MAPTLSPLGIGQSVGRGGRNQTGDVRHVQQLLLNNAFRMPPVRSAGITGRCDDLTITHIAVFQRYVLNMTNPNGLVEPNGPTLQALNGKARTAPDRNGDLDRALDRLRAEALNLANRFIRDSRIRACYLAAAERLAGETRAEVAAGRLTRAEGVALAQQTRQQIQDATRAPGRAIPRPRGEASRNAGGLADLRDATARQLHGRAYAELPDRNQDQVLLAIIEQAGRRSAPAPLKSTRLGRLARGLIVVSNGYALQPTATPRERTPDRASDPSGSEVLVGRALGALNLSGLTATFEGFKV